MFLAIHPGCGWKNRVAQAVCYGRKEVPTVADIGWENIGTVVGEIGRTNTSIAARDATATQTDCAGRT